MQGLDAKIGQNGKFAKFSCRENFMFYSRLEIVEHLAYGLIQEPIHISSKIDPGIKNCIRVKLGVPCRLLRPRLLLHWVEFKENPYFEVFQFFDSYLEWL